MQIPAGESQYSGEEEREEAVASHALAALQINHAKMTTK